ncbi:hypothetical protein QJQ45_018715 [Haematococcus lacustris]|nr:hypothetical protein QJQ45_018715 [Haematococcus lacustris]
MQLPLQSGAAPGHTPNPPHLRQPSPSRLAPAPSSLLPATAPPERTRWAAPIAPTPAAGGPPRAPLKRSSSSGSGGHPPDPRPSPASPGKAGRGGGRGRGQAGANQPVTFHRKVKSSGYGFVHPAARLGRPPPSPVSVRTRPCAASTVAKHLLQARQYPVSSGPPAHPQPQHCLPGQAPLHQGALLRLRFSGDASRLLTCSADRTARVIKLPLAKHQVKHPSSGSARLWNAGCAQPLLELSHLQQQQPRLALGGAAAGSGPGAGAGGAGAAAPTLSTVLAAGAASAAAAKANPPFLHEVRAARFYYLDEFILLAAGNKLNLYRYKLGEGDPNDDIARLRNTNKYRLAASYASNMQAINDFASVNSFLSPLALLAGTNRWAGHSRSVEVLDCTVMQCVAVVEDAHARPVHTIAQSASASLYTSHPKEALELFLTAACDGLIKLWDVRSCRCVRSFSAHKNTQITTGAAFSPCLRFIASGSEDQAAYLYDVRQGQMLHRMRTSDVVTDVAFNPLHPQLAAGCLDGRVHFFSVA